MLVLLQGRDFLGGPAVTETVAGKRPSQEDLSAGSAETPVDAGGSSGQHTGVHGPGKGEGGLGVRVLQLQERGHRERGAAHGPVHRADAELHLELADKERVHEERDIGAVQLH